MASLAAASTNLATTSGITASAEMEAASVVIPSLPLMSDTEDAMVVEESSELGIIFGFVKNVYFLKYFISKLYFSDDPETLDLSSHGLTKLSRAAPGYELTTMTLLLDNNSLQRLDNIHTYQCLEKVSKHLETIFFVNKNEFTEKKHFSETPQKNLPEIQKTLKT